MNKKYEEKDEFLYKGNKWFVINWKSGIERVKKLLELYPISEQTERDVFLTFGYKILSPGDKETYYLLKDLALLNEYNKKEYKCQVSLEYLAEVLDTTTFCQSRRVKKLRRAGYKTRLACTRKVAPGLSYFDKKAVMLGGGDTHRLHLDDLVLIKDNHLVILGSVGQAVEKVRSAVSFSKKIEVEVSKEGKAIEAAKAGADIIMLDNFSPQQVKGTIALLQREGLRNKVLIEVSGGVNKQNILKFADTGPDILSLGEITDSAKTFDMSLSIVKVKKNKT